MSIASKTVSELSISEAERRSGVAKETLRVWERRYGFPTPSRDAAGDRLYTQQDVEKLRLMKALIDRGERPARLAALSHDTLAARLPVHGGREPAQGPESAALDVWVEDALDRLRRHDVDGLRDLMQSTILAQGLGRFVQDSISPLTHAVGEAWIAGQLEVYEEHLFTEQTVRVLRGAIDSLPRPAAARPRIVLTTLPGEPHALGLLMAECILTLGGARCFSLGSETPTAQIVGAASAYRADIVALSFSAMTPLAAAQAMTAELCAQLPATTELWVGGAGAGRTGPMPQTFRPLVGLAEIPSALDRWRSERLSAS